MSDYLAPAFAVVLPNLGGIAGGFLTKRAIPEWYEVSFIWCCGSSLTYVGGCSFMIIQNSCMFVL